MRPADVRALTAELLTGAAAVAGWLLVTAGVAAFAPPRVVWAVSLGLLLLSGCGWRFLAALAWEGLYVLTRSEPAQRRARRKVA